MKKKTPNETEGFTSVMRHYVTLTPEGFYHVQNMIRVMTGLERARSQDKKLGRPQQSGKIYRKPVLMDVAGLHSQGKSIREIAKELETSKYWVEYSINEIHRNLDKLKGVSC